MEEAVVETRVDELFETLRRCRRSDLPAFADAWVGLEPTFSNKKAVRKWARMSAEEGGEDAYFEDEWMVRKMRKIGRAIAKDYAARLEQSDPGCCFPAVELEHDRDPWNDRRVNLKFHADGERSEKSTEAFEVRLGMDPETFEFSIKPVPLVWLRDEKFVRFLQLFVWDVPMAHGLSTSMAHGGGQFSFSAKTFMQGSLLADDIASRLDHPELSTWISDYPNADDRAFRATRKRFDAFRAILDQYWRGAFHPLSIGELRVENALLDRGFDPACNPHAGALGAKRGLSGDARAIFQTNFAFGRAVRWHAQDVHPGYWQSQHPDEEGYRPDQIMRYSEGNLNRLQIAGELHVKSGKVLDAREVPQFDAPLEASMLYDEASWENRAQMSRTSAEDFVEAALLEAHHAEWLTQHPHVSVRATLAQDAILMDAETTLQHRDPRALSKLKKQARKSNLEASRGRIKSEFIEPETLFWAAWRVLKPGEQAEIAREAITGFVERVENAATVDPRKTWNDPMEPHRHRVHPLLWEALSADAGAYESNPTLKREARRWRENRARYEAKRSPWSPTGAQPPWA